MDFVGCGKRQNVVRKKEKRETDRWIDRERDIFEKEKEGERKDPAAGAIEVRLQHGPGSQRALFPTSTKHDCNHSR